MSSDPSVARGLLIVVSAPSGTGKTTVVDRLVAITPGVERSCSYTTRPPRAAEADRVDYNFVSRDDFDRMVARQEFLEWADVFGNRYGTRRADTDARLDRGVDLVLVIDVQGARQVRRAMPDAVAVFVLPPSFEVLERRLRARSLDPDEAIRRRLATARDEITAVDEYDYVILNDDLETCVRDLAAIITAEHARRPRRQRDVEPIMRSFKAMDEREPMARGEE